MYVHGLSLSALLHTRTTMGGVSHSMKAACPSYQADLRAERALLANDPIAGPTSLTARGENVMVAEPAETGKDPSNTAALAALLGILFCSGCKCTVLDVSPYIIIGLVAAILGIERIMEAINGGK